MDFPKRKPNRLPYFDYNTPGAYFITVCTENKIPILSRIVGGGALDAPHVQLTKIGHIVQKYIISGNRVRGITVDKFVIMPNHIHLILLVDEQSTTEAPHIPSPANSIIPHFISTLKRFCHRDAGKRFFQRSYHDHVIRNEEDYLMIWQYIDNNPARWQEDRFYPAPFTRGVEGAAPYITPMEERT